MAGPRCVACGGGTRGTAGGSGRTGRPGPVGPAAPCSRHRVSRMAAASERPVTASHPSAVSRSRVAEARRNRTCEAGRCSTSSWLKYSTTRRASPVKVSSRVVGSGWRRNMEGSARRCSAAHPSVRSARARAHLAGCGAGRGGGSVATASSGVRRRSSARTSAHGLRPRHSSTGRRVCGARRRPGAARREVGDHAPKARYISSRAAAPRRRSAPPETSPSGRPAAGNGWSAGRGGGRVTAGRTGGRPISGRLGAGRLRTGRRGADWRGRTGEVRAGRTSRADAGRWPGVDGLEPPRPGRGRRLDGFRSGAAENRADRRRPARCRPPRRGARPREGPCWPSPTAAPSCLTPWAWSRWSPGGRDARAQLGMEMVHGQPPRRQSRKPRRRCTVHSPAPRRGAAPSPGSAGSNAGPASTALAEPEVTSVGGPLIPGPEHVEAPTPVSQDDAV